MCERGGRYDGVFRVSSIASYGMGQLTLKITNTGHPTPTGVLQDTLTLIVVNEAEGSALVVLGDDNVAAVAALAIDGLEAPDLDGSPAAGSADNVGLEEGFVVLGIPALLEELVLDFGHLKPLGAAGDIAEDLVVRVTGNIVDAAVLVSGAQAASGLSDLNVPNIVRVSAGSLGRRLELVDVDADGGKVDTLADQVSDTLNGQTVLGRVRDGLVLQ